MSRVHETNLVVAAPLSFAWVVLALIWLYSLSFIIIHYGVLAPQEVENRAFTLVWLLANTTAWDYRPSRDNEPI